MRKEEQKEAFREEYRLLGLKIAYYRKKRGYTQEQLADRAECSWSFLSQLEANNGDRIHAPSLYTLFWIARALEIMDCRPVWAAIFCACGALRRPPVASSPPTAMPPNLGGIVGFAGGYPNSFRRIP